MGLDDDEGGGGGGGNNEENDYDTDANWKTAGTTIVKSATSDGIGQQRSLMRPLTVHQIIAKRMPELGLPEMIRGSCGQTSPELGRSGNPVHIGSSGKYNRISSYDNVEKHTNGGGGGSAGGYGTSAMCHGSSAHSDDGTVFSEPWDSSQWDSFLPHDGKLIVYWAKFQRISNL